MRPAELHTEFKLSSRILGHTICNKNTLRAAPSTFLCNRNLQRSLCVRQNYTQNSNCPAEFWDIQSATRTHYRLSHIHSYAIEICREVYASGRTTHRIQTVQQNSGTYNLQQEHTTGSAIYILMQQKSAEKSMRPAELHTEFKLSSRILGHTICNKNTLPAQPYTFLCNRNLQRSLCVRQNYTQNSNCPAEFWDIQSATRTHYELRHLHSYAIEICREVYASGRTTHRIQTVQQNSGTYNLQQEHTTGSAIFILMQ